MHDSLDFHRYRIRAEIDNPDPHDCSKLPDYNKLKTALTEAVKQGKEANGGLGNQEWGTVVNRDGIVCAVVFTGPNRAAEWLAAASSPR